jgi:hypothetical protein
MKKWIFFLGSCALVIGAIPFLASLSPLTNLLLSYAGAKYGVAVTAKEARFSWLGPQRFQAIQVSSPEIKGSIERLSSSVPFWSLSKMGRSLEVVGGSFQITTEKGQLASVEQIEATVRGPAISAHGITSEGGQTGEFSIQGQAVRPSLEKPDFDITATATRMPTLFVDRLLHAQGLLASAIGPTFDASAHITVKNEEGTVRLQLESPASQIQFDGNFNSDSFSLNQPLLVFFRLTTELSEVLLKNVNPLFLTGIQSKDPVSLRVSNRNFSCPRPISLQRLKIEEGILDMGQVRIQNGPTLASLVNLLKNDVLANLKVMNAWFTPLRFSIHEGKVATGRMDVLIADSVHICTWGDIDLRHNLLSMNLGLPAATLANAFGLRNLPTSYVLKIPIRGTTDHPELVTGPAAAKIAAMLATQSIPNKAGPVGGLIQLLAPAALDDSSDVPPAQRPFPWERRN